MNHGSLFSGIGGIDLGFERAGIKTIWQVENDRYATRILEKNFPGVRRYGDIKAIRWEEVECPDIISGGFPCQDISQAGKGLGIVAGKRSSLWFEFIKAVGVLRPRYVLVENVAALPKRGLDIVLAGLAKEGYDAEWFDLRASDFGAWHKRERIFIVAYSNDYGLSPTKNRKSIVEKGNTRQEKQNETWESSGLCQQHGIMEIVPQERLCLSDSCIIRCLHIQVQEQPGEGREQTFTEIAPSNPEIADSSSERLERQVNQARQIARCGYWEAESKLGRVVDGVPDWVDRIKCLGNAVVPQIAEYIGRLIVEFDRGIGERKGNSPLVQEKPKKERECHG